MEFKIAHLEQPVNAELVSTLGESEAMVKIIRLIIASKSCLYKYS
jgi:hypothetical protein